MFLSAAPIKVQKTMSDGDFSVPACSFSGRYNEMVGAMVLKPSMPDCCRADMVAKIERSLVDSCAPQQELYAAW